MPKDPTSKRYQSAFARGYRTVTFTPAEWQALARQVAPDVPPESVEPNTVKLYLWHLHEPQTKQQ